MGEAVLHGVAAHVRVAAQDGGQGDEAAVLRAVERLDVCELRSGYRVGGLSLLCRRAHHRE